MCWKTVGLAAVVVLAVPVAGTGQDIQFVTGTPATGYQAPATGYPRDRSRPALIVRTYNMHGVSVEDLQSARMSVHTIFDDAGVDVLWMDCSSKDRKTPVPTECLQPRGSNEVMLRLMGTTTVPDKLFVQLGSALVTLQESPPYFATVFADLVGFVARGTKSDFRALLGRAIAHEIGHLLLNTSGHSDRGLMRAAWSRAELVQNDPADWVFRRDEAAIIRVAAANRAGQRNLDIGRSTMD